MNVQQLISQQLSLLGKRPFHQNINEVQGVQEALANYAGDNTGAQALVGGIPPEIQQIPADENKLISQQNQAILESNLAQQINPPRQHAEGEHPGLDSVKLAPFQNNTDTQSESKDNDDYVDDENLNGQSQGPNASGISGSANDATKISSGAQANMKQTQAQLLGKTAGRWTHAEHKKFVQALKIFGKDWKKVEDYVQTRSGAQIRSHAQKYFIRIQKKLKGDSGVYLNQTEDQCNTNKGLELFRQIIARYEEGVKDDSNDEDYDDDIKSLPHKRVLRTEYDIQSPASSLFPMIETQRSNFGQSSFNGLGLLQQAQLGLGLGRPNPTNLLGEALGTQAMNLNNRLAQALKEQQQSQLARLLPSVSQLGETANHQFQLPGISTTESLLPRQTSQPGLTSQAAAPQPMLSQLQLSQQQAPKPILNPTAIVPQQQSLIQKPQATPASISSLLFLQNEKKQIQSAFLEVVRRKEAITHEIYLNDSTDLLADGAKFLKTIEEILNDIQVLSSKVTNYNHISGLLDSIMQTNQMSSLMLERLLILINEVVSLQKVLLELINNSFQFNKQKLI